MEIFYKGSDASFDLWHYRHKSDFEDKTPLFSLYFLRRLDKKNDMLAPVFFSLTFFPLLCLHSSSSFLGWLKVAQVLLLLKPLLSLSHCPCLSLTFLPVLQRGTHEFGLNSLGLFEIPNFDGLKQDLSHWPEI